jgi:hypothetical protein
MTVIVEITVAIILTKTGPFAFFYIFFSFLFGFSLLQEYSFVYVSVYQHSLSCVWFVVSWLEMVMHKVWPCVNWDSASSRTMTVVLLVSTVIKGQSFFISLLVCTRTLSWPHKARKFYFQISIPWGADRRSLQSISDSSVGMSWFGRYHSWNVLLKCDITGKILKMLWSFKFIDGFIVSKMQKFNYLSQSVLCYNVSKWHKFLALSQVSVP